METVLVKAKDTMCFGHPPGSYQDGPGNSCFEKSFLIPMCVLAAAQHRYLLNLDEVLLAEKPDAVLTQGDTTTVMTVALACLYHKISFGYVEAGLLTCDLQNPFPEEMNRAVAGRLAKRHFAPTESSRQDLLREGGADVDILVTGNTVIDALLSVAEHDASLPYGLDPAKRLILMTAHRRGNSGEPFEQVCRAVLALLEGNSDVQVLFPAHPNPNVHEAAYRLLGTHPRAVFQ